jgi:hypothetical protein
MPRLPEWWSASTHPNEGALRAYLDGELAPSAALQCAIHVRRCSSCRRLLGELGEQGELAGNLLSVALTPPRRGRRPYVGAVIGLASAGVLGAILVATLLRQPATHTRTADGVRVQDVCCFNLDGGGHPDDGMVTVSRAGQVVDCVVLYEDRAGTRTFAPQDPLRFISRPPGCSIGVFSPAGS